MGICDLVFDTDTMVDFMNRSITGMEKHAVESNNMFRMTRRGYAFLSENPSMADAYRTAAVNASTWGAGKFSKLNYSYK